MTSTHSDAPVKEALNFKIIIIGDAGVGKTSLLHYFIFNKFKREPKQTVNVEYSSKSIFIGEQEVRLQLWDTAGQERYKSVTKSYYKNALGIIIVYDITKSSSFQSVSTWLGDAKGIAKKNCGIALVGNKCDLKEEREVTYIDGVKYCQDNSLMHFETSAVTGESIDDVFNKLATAIYQRVNEGLIELEEKKVDNFVINEQSAPTQAKSCYESC